MSNENVSVCGDGPTENYQLNLQLHLTLQSFIVSFSSLLLLVQAAVRENCPPAAQQQKPDRSSLRLRLGIFLWNW